jgi:hypothetical protein
MAFGAEPNPTFHVTRASGPITVDGRLDDEAWKNATKIEKWWETNVAENGPPPAKSTGWLTYDDKYFYAAFQFDDPNPKEIRGPFNDRDHIGGNTDDYAGVIIDARNDGKTAVLFLANVRGVQYDAVSDDTTGNEDNSPDFFWDAATTLTETGWNLELRIPFSSLRYASRNPEAWGIMLYRNYPRDRRYQMFANQLPKGNNCFICNENKMTGLENLPPGGHMVIAPYVTGKMIGEPRDGVAGNDLRNRPAKGDGGLDFKWTPSPDTAIDATINPDFSQIESDSAVIATNQRFAIFYPERRPFFLEGVELFSTPIQAVYTRTITSPRWGLRSTGKFGSNAYTLLVAQDRGGGLVTLPSPLGSGFAEQDFSSTVAIGRIRHDIGKSFVSFLGTVREEQGGAHNRVFGPDFQWKTEHDNITGQFLVSDSQTPDRPDLSSEWNGQKLRSHAGFIWWSHSTKTWDYYAEYSDYGDKFRADNGFVPQVGYRNNYAEVGRTWFPEKAFFNRFRLFAMGQYQSLQDGSELYRLLSFGFGADGKFRSFSRWRYAYETVRNGNDLFQRHQLLFSEQFSVSKLVPQVSLNGWVGQDVDFDNNRLARGANINVAATVRPTNHLELAISTGESWLTPHGQNEDHRLFTSQFERIRATYTFNAKMFLRAIVQNTRNNFNQGLYTFPIDQHSGSFSSQLLLAYKLNWQTVMYVGYSDLQSVLNTENNFATANRQYFFKLSYAFQR